jgi:hypothetical protein
MFNWYWYWYWYVIYLLYWSEGLGPSLPRATEMQVRTILYYVFALRCESLFVSQDFRLNPPPPLHILSPSLRPFFLPVVPPPLSGREGGSLSLLSQWSVDFVRRVDGRCFTCPYSFDPPRERGGGGRGWNGWHGYPLYTGTIFIGLHAAAVWVAQFIYEYVW